MEPPSEDCGDILGYHNMPDALANTSHPDHSRIAEYLNGRDSKEIDELPLRIAFGCISNRCNAARSRIARKSGCWAAGNGHLKLRLCWAVADHRRSPESPTRSMVIRQRRPRVRGLISGREGKPTLKTYGIAYATTLVVFLAIDALWLTLAAQRLYRPLMGGMLLEGFSLVPAALFYVIYIAGIVVFAITPALSSGRWATAMLHGAFLGFVAYATYDLTNQATLRHWPLAVTIADLCWGTFLTATAATIGFLLTHALTFPP